MDWEKLKGQFETLKTGIETRVKELLAEQSDAANAVVEVLKAQQVATDEALTAIKSELEAKRSVGLPGLEDEKQKFSMVRYLRALLIDAAGGKASISKVSDPWAAADAEFEKEVVTQYTEKQSEIFNRFSAYMTPNGARAFTAGDGSSGGFLVPPDAPQPIIDLAIQDMPILNIPGVTKLTGAVGDVPIPKVVGRPTAQHRAENQAPTESTGEFGIEWMRPKLVKVFCKVSNRLLFQNEALANTEIKKMMGESLAIEQHEKLITGAGAQNEPVGLLNTAGVTTTVAGSNLALGGRLLTADDAWNLQMALAGINELKNTGKYAYLWHPFVEWGIRRQTVQQFTAQGRRNGQPIMGMSSLGLLENQLAPLLGYPSFKSTDMPRNENTSGVPTAGQTNSTAIFADWTKYYHVTWRDTVIRVSDQAGDGGTGSAFMDDQLYIVMFLEYDARFLRPTALAKMVGAETDPSSW